jgi:hypothetical protein
MERALLVAAVLKDMCGSPLLLLLLVVVVHCQPFPAVEVR